jgi:uncharacterized lipoprotein YddW (UPF0748 family)
MKGLKMNRRDLLKTLSLSSIAILAEPLAKGNLLYGKENDTKLKNWSWIGNDTETSGNEWKKIFAGMKEAGIDAILPEIFNSHFAFYASKHLPVKDQWLERILPIAKSEGLEVHAWIWTMICNIEEIYKEHPEWYMVNRNGDSCLIKPAYVPSYRFLCPSRSEPLDFIAKRVKELSQYDNLDGVHLDFVRYPDVILAESLQPKYGIIQDREYPEYDYCYCDVCRKSFKDKTGLDPMDLKDPTANVEWRQYRYDTISNFVNNKLIPIAREFKKEITAAVFPPYNWIHVRQQWPNWNLDTVLPMLYHNFYYQGIEWIKEQTEKGIYSLRRDEPLYSGLMVSAFSPDGLSKAVEAAIAGGAKGVVLFESHSMTDEHWKSFKEVISRY